jgi:hypothetical protein
MSPSPGFGPWDNTYDYKGRATLALASYYLSGNLAAANDAINQLHNDNFPRVGHGHGGIDLGARRSNPREPTGAAPSPPSDPG